MQTTVGREAGGPMRTGQGRWVVLAWVLPLVATPAAALPLADCAYEAPRVPGPRGAPFVEVLLPDDDLFRPPLADIQEPRFVLAYRWVDLFDRGLPAATNDATEMHAGITGAGGSFGLWALRRRVGCDGIQVNLAGTVISLFNLDPISNELVDTDFIIALPIAARWGAWSARLTVLHESDHLGDEFLLNNPDVVRENVNINSIDLLVSYEGAWWRAYGGFGYIFYDQPEFEPLFVKWGIEGRGPPQAGFILPATWFRAVAGVDFTGLQTRDWGLTAGFRAGVEVTSPSATRRLRLLLAYERGFTRFGQFFRTERQQAFGVESQFEF